MIRWALLASVFVAVLSLPKSAESQDHLAHVCESNCSHNRVPLHDQIVLASTRNYASVVGKTLDLNTFVGRQCTVDGQCTHQAVCLFEDHPFIETWIFVHGNQISKDMAVERGTRVYRTLRACSENKGPIRFIIWSWPSVRETNRIADARIKSKRTDAESFYFGNFLAAYSENGPTSIIGYSFGARVVSGGLHLANGGCINGFYLPNNAMPDQTYRIAFLAAAVEHDGVLPGGRYERALAITDRLLLQNNSADQALRFFWILNSSRPKALGITGLSHSPPDCCVQQFDWEEAIGKDHSVWQYIDRPTIVNHILATIAR